MGKTYGPWEVVRSIGEGGQGYAYVVKRSPDVREYVLKRIKNKNRIARFKNEIEAGLALNHPNVLRVIDHNLEDGTEPWVVTEYCSGGPLSQFSRAESIGQLLELFQQVCAGVASAHERGIAHRDIKPDNIFLRADGTVAVGDFGLCHFLDDDERITFTEEVVGPRWYMAPELEDGRVDQVTTRCDVYSLGKLLYWMIRGRIFSREKHREADYYFGKDSKNSEDYLVYELFDKTIVAEPARRFRDGGELHREVVILRRRIAAGAHAIGKDVPQPCNYCGLGMYVQVVDSRSSDVAVHNFGFNQVGASDWRVMACNHCAHVQIFRPDTIRGFGMSRPSPWDK